MTVFISNLPDQITEVELLELFEEYGPVKDIVLPRNLKTKQVCGFAFVDMLEKAHEAAATSELNGSKWMGSRLQVSEMGVTNWCDDLDLADLLEPADL